MRIARIVASLIALSGCAQSPDALHGNEATENQASSDVSPIELPSGLLSRENIIAYAFKVQRYERTDQFSKSLDQTPLIGRKFSISVPFDTDNIYDADKEVITLSLHPATPCKNCYTDLLEVFSDSDYGTEVLKSNAFGASVKVTPIVKTIVGISNDQAGGMGVLRMDRYAPRLYAYPALEKVIKIPPAEARQALDGLTVVYEGELVKPKEGQLISCFKNTKLAEIDDPYETETKFCHVNVRLTRIRFISPSAGVLAEWKR